ncbi:hypothetical protein MMC31_007490, partial [Peltigera leucophlebia]|nr:hypothetical protein [Peltigera leucophlebia]
SSMNRIIIGKERDGYHPQKDASFDILSLADQLHKSRSTYPKGPERGKIYLSENQVPDLIKLGQDHLPQVIKAYKEAVWKNLVDIERTLMPDDESGNEAVDELFRQAREDAAVTSDLTEMFD